MQINSKSISIPGAVGRLDGLMDFTEDESSQYITICCHPHPQHQGTMTNKVIHTAARTLAGLGVTSIRFNFRGVGESEGAYAEGIGEQEDLLAVVSWVELIYPEREIVLIGFSFGAYITAMQAKNINPCILISIAPPVGRIEFKGFERPDCPWLIIQGEQDELVDSNSVLNWSLIFEPKVAIVMMADTSHFFHRKLVDLRKYIESFCSEHLNLS